MLNRNFIDLKQAITDPDNMKEEIKEILGR